MRLLKTWERRIVEKDTLTFPSSLRLFDKGVR